MKPETTHSRRAAFALRPGIASLALLCLCAVPAAAQVDAGNVDQVRDAFDAAVSGMGSRLATIARNLLVSLLLIEMVWTLGRTVMAGSDFSALMGQFFRRVIIVGLFLFLIEGIPTPQGTVGIAAFVLMAAEGLLDVVEPGATLSPADLLGLMFETGAAIYDNSSGIGGGVTAALVWILLVLMGAIIAGLLLVAYVEIYVIFTVGILALGFGAWKVTETFAHNLLFAAVGKIFKLFTLLIIAVVIKLQLESFGSLASFEDGIIAVGVVLIFVMVILSVPAAVEGMFAGGVSASADTKASEYITAMPKKGAAKTAETVGKGVKRGGGAVVRAGGGAAKRALGGKLASTIRSIGKSA